MAGRVVLVLAAMIFQPGATTAAVPGSDVTYTTDANFDQGTLVNVNHDAPNNNQLQLNTGSGTFPFIWVALSIRCTIAKINTTTGAILGEYRTISDLATCNQSSRTTVALDGSVWVGHRGPGGVTHVGLVELSQCVDRNGNGMIDTSTAYGDVKPWAGSDSDLADAEDECILHHVDTVALGLSDSRHMSIDANNKLWVGDYAGGHNFIRVNGLSGAVETSLRTFACGGYGGLIDNAGVIWSANGGSTGLLRWDPNTPDSATNPVCIGIPAYGLAIDPNGFIWASALGGNRVWKISPDGATVLGPFGHGSDSAQGLAVTSDGDVWVSSSLFCGAGCTVGHLKNDGTFVGNVDNPTGAGSTGVAVDAAGKVWTVNLNSHTATRIDPMAGTIGADAVTPIGAVDLTVSFPAGPDGRPLPAPYNYSDMTGSQLLGTVPQGTWTVVQDSGSVGTAWSTVTWNTEPQGSEPAGSSITVEARAADSEAGLGAQSFVVVGNGAALAVSGQFIQVRVTLKPNDDGVSPVLSDLRIRGQTVCVPAPEDCDNGVDDDCDLLFDCMDRESCGGTPECPIGNDPSAIYFDDSGSGADYFRSHGRLPLRGPLDVGAMGFSVVLSNSQGAVFSSSVPGGAFIDGGTFLTFTNRAVRRGRGGGPGIYRVRILTNNRNRAFYWVKAYGDFSRATEPTMTLQVRLGDQWFGLTDEWRRTSRGWRLRHLDVR